MQGFFWRSRFFEIFFGQKSFAPPKNLPAPTPMPVATTHPITWNSRPLPGFARATASLAVNRPTGGETQENSDFETLVVFWRWYRQLRWKQGQCCANVLSRCLHECNKPEIRGLESCPNHRIFRFNPTSQPQLQSCMTRLQLSRKTYV